MYGAGYKLEKWKEKPMILTFYSHIFNCVCHSIRSMFGVLGIYNFESSVKKIAIRKQMLIGNKWRPKLNRGQLLNYLKYLSFREHVCDLLYTEVVIFFYIFRIQFYHVNFFPQTKQASKFLKVNPKSVVLKTHIPILNA